MAASEPGRDDPLVSFYRERIAAPATVDEAYGYWLFAVGLIATVIGAALVVYSATLDHSVGNYWTVRQAGVVLVAGGIPVLFGGDAIRLPLREAAATLTYVGIGVCLVAVAWFISVYPGDWPAETGEAAIMALYTLGLGFVALAAVVVPILSWSETETARSRSTRADSDAAGRVGRDDLEPPRGDRADRQAAADASPDEGEPLRKSRARFEVYEDVRGEWRWRLVHDDGHVLADSGEGYADRHSAKDAVDSVKRNAPGAAETDI